MQASPRNQFVCTVVANVPVCRDHYRLVLGLRAFPPSYPGQFVQVACRNLDLNCSPEHEADWEPGKPLGVVGRELMAPLAMLRRPFSLAGRRETDNGVELEVLHRVVGTGTDWLAHLKAGETVHLLGPLGNHFELPAANELAVLVGGGVGIPPMIYMAEKLAGRKAVAFCGALSRDLLALNITGEASAEGDPRACIEEFARHGVPTVITTDDGSFGYRGLITQALERFLDSQTLTPVIYTCGPEPMMKRVAEIALSRKIACQISVERAMACGMGTCQSCVIRVRKPDASKPPLAGQDWCYRLACTDGPVFKADVLLW